MLATYNYTMTYKPGKDIPVADALSRLPTDEIQNNNTVPIPGETVMFLEHLDTTPVTSQKIATWTKRDTVLSQVLDMTRRGIFPQHPSDDLKPYVTRKNELSIQDDVLLWGNHTSSWTSDIARRTTPNSPWYCSHEVLSKNYYLVAKDGCRH